MNFNLSYLYGLSRKGGKVYMKKESQICFNTNYQKIFLIFRFLVLLCITACLLTACLSEEEKAERKMIQANMKTYLEEAYGMPFVVKTVRVQSNTGFGYIRHIAHAYPKEDKEMKIVVTYDKNTGEFEDSYLGTKWTNEGKAYMEEKLREVYGDNFYIQNFDFYYNAKDYKDLSFEEVYKKRAGSIRIDLGYFVYLENEINRYDEAEKAYKILKENFIEAGEAHVLQYFFAVEYIRQGERDKHEKMIAHPSKDEEPFSPSYLYENGLLVDWFRLSYTKSLKDEEPEVKSAEEIEKKFRIFYNITRD